MKNTSLNMLLTGVILTSTFSGFAQAAEKEAKAKPTNETPDDDKKVDISDLESKYWAPKDTDFSVVQNRTYPKEGKIFISPQYGRLVNDQYSEGSVMGLSGQYFFSERFGVQVESFTTSLKLNQAMRDLGSQFSTGVQPDHGILTGYQGIGINMVPFYAKMSVLGKRIIYFDMAFTPVIGMSTYEQAVQTGNVKKSALTYGFDVSQYFLFNKWVAVRTDLKSHWRSEDVVHFRGALIGQKVKDKTTYDTLFTMGLMFFW